MDQTKQKNEKKHNYFYKTTNKVNGKYYYGIHSTDNLEDGYMGSGNTILRAFKKHGKENFIKEIIADYQTRKEASDHEKSVVTEELIELGECYNLRTGGDCNYNFSNVLKIKLSIIAKCRKHSEKTKQKMSVSKRGINNPNYGKKCSDEAKAKISLANKCKSKMKGELHPQFGKQRSEETKNKISKANSGKKRTIEQCKNISNGLKGTQNCLGRVLTWETKEKIGLKHKGKILSDKTRAKISMNSISNKRCIINNLEFNSITNAVKYLNLTSRIVSNRLKSDSEEWVDWQFIKN